MKGLIICSVIVLAVLAGCSKGTEETGIGGTGTGDAMITVEAFDSPPPSDIEHIYLAIREVSIHSSDRGWVTLAEPNETYDFLELIGGATATLVDTALAPGHYSQMRLVLADTNQVVVDGQTHELTVPSGEQSGVKFNLNINVEEDELVEILVDFDASKSINYASRDYKLRPVFKAFKKTVSGTVSGDVRNATGEAIPNALIEATASESSTSTVTDSSGTYKLILIEGIYELQASAEGSTTADTTYAGVDVNAGDNLTGFDFVLQE